MNVGSVAQRVQAAIQESLMQRKIISILVQLRSEEQVALCDELQLESDQFKKFRSATNTNDIIREYRGIIEHQMWCVLVVAKQIH